MTYNSFEELSDNLCRSHWQLLKLQMASYVSFMRFTASKSSEFYSSPIFTVYSFAKAILECFILDWFLNRLWNEKLDVYLVIQRFKVIFIRFHFSFR